MASPSPAPADSAGADATAPPPPTPRPPPDPLAERSLKQYSVVQLPTPEQIAQEDFMNNCGVRGVISVVMGGAMGAVMGIMFAGMEAPNMGAEAATIPLRQHFFTGLKVARERSVSYAKTFSYLGGLYATSECVVEKFRGKHDVVNSAAAGCFSGGFMAIKQGPLAMAGGCASFAAFSVLIDKVMEGM